jgi:hypothetical protein
VNAFPVVDPIPLPAPVWLFKTLHLLTLSLHFVAVEILLGGLIIAVVLNALGVSGRGGAAAPFRRGAAAAIARRLPVVMTFVINLGVPPLLFAQVLYGRALYTSSVLIGAYWIAVIGLLMACYWLLYRFAEAAEAGKSAWWLGGASWLLAGAIARILSTNMTLMLRPDVWREMYSASASGTHLPPFDPTLLPRWLFMLIGGVMVGGLWMIWIAGRKSVDAPLKPYLANVGGAVAAMSMVAQVFVLMWVLRAQPAVVTAGVAGSALLSGARLAWFGSAVLIMGFSTWAALKKPATGATGYAAALLAFVALASWTVLRDGIRDLTLGGHGFDVWQRIVVTNWSVVGLFFAVFVAGLGALAWLASVVMRATTIPERVI